MRRARRIAALVATAGAGCALWAAPVGAVSAAPAPAPPATPAPAAGLTPVLTGHSAWAWGNPTPQGQPLDAVAFQGPDGYAVGAVGTILRSTDAGRTWSGLPSGTTDDLDLVQELNPSTVVAAGGCSAVESTNAGASFTELPLSRRGDCTNGVAGIAFTDGHHGYLELRDGTLLQTADGGVSLQRKRSPAVGQGRATGLAFFSPTTGLAVSSSGLIERTTDGGNSWTQVLSAPAQLNGVTIVGPRLAYAVGNQGELERSTDGGITWQSRPLALDGAATLPNLTTIACANTEDCLIATTDPNELVRTSDGGQSGAVVSVSDPAPTAVAYATGSTVVGVGAEGATAISNDAGRTFATVSRDPLSRFVANQDLVAGRARASAYLAGQDGKIAATTDSGTSWSLIHVPTSQQIMSLAFASDQVGYALDRKGVLRRTADGGGSWRTFSQTHSFSSTLITPTAKSVLLVGPTGVRRSTDGGASFREVGGRERVGRGRGAKVSSLTLQHAVAHGRFVVGWGGPKGRIAVSADGGQVWRSVPTPPGASATALYEGDAVSASRLWFLDFRGLWSTTDGGRHWRQLGALGEHDLGYNQLLSFSSARDGLVSVDTPLVTSGPFNEVNVLRTADGGRTWTPEILGGQDAAPSLDGVRATPTGDITALSFSIPGSVSQYNGFFTTAGVAAPARHTRLRVRFAQRRMSARALARAGHRVLVTGHLSPVLFSGETVAVTAQARPRARWTLQLVRVAGNGSFRLHLTGVRGGAQVVAQALGTSTVAGAGTPVARFGVRR